MMSTGTKRKRRRRAEVLHRWVLPIGAKKRAETISARILQFKGFGGGVPLNTERAAVKPRVGIEKIAKRCLFFVEMAWAGSETTLPALLLSAVVI